ncbi:21344_t:CDS:2, partial [Gigaspora margarita]
MDFLEKYTANQKRLYRTLFPYFTSNDSSTWTRENYMLYGKKRTKGNYSGNTFFEFYKLGLLQCLYTSKIDQKTFNKKYKEASKDQDADPSEHKISILGKKNYEEALNINYDEPICSSIIDTGNIPEWIRKEFSDKEWNIISDTKDENPTPKKRKKIGKKPNFSIVSKAKLFQKKLELLVGEVSNSPWKEKNDKTNR